MANCKISFIVNDSSGASTSIELEVPQEYTSDINKLSEYLIKNKEDEKVSSAFADLVEAVNETQYVAAEFKIDNFRDRQTEDVESKTVPNNLLPICDNNLNKMLDETNFTSKMFKDIGEDVDKFNILINNTAPKYKKNVSMFTTPKGETVYILPNNPKIKLNFVKARYVIGTSKNDQEMIDLVLSLINSLNLSGFDVKNSSNELIVQSFILKYYLDDNFGSNIDRNTYGDFGSFLLKYLPQETYIKKSEQYGWAQDLIKDGRISIEDFKKEFTSRYLDLAENINNEYKDTYQNKIKYQEELLKILNNINRDPNASYINVTKAFPNFVYVDLKLDYDPKLLEKEETVNSELVSIKAPIIAYYKGKFIYKYGGNYYFEDYILSDTSKFKNKSGYRRISEIKRAITGAVKNRKLKATNLSSQTALKVHIHEKGLTTVRKTKAKEENKKYKRLYPEDTLIPTLNIPVKAINRKALPALFNDTEINYFNAINQLKQPQNPYKEFIEQWELEEGIVFKEIINTSEKLTTLINNTYDSLYDLELSYDDKYNIFRGEIDKIKNADVIFYKYNLVEEQNEKGEIVGYNVFTPYQLKSDAPAIVKKDKSFKFDLVSAISKFRSHYSDSSIVVITNKELNQNDELKKIKNVQNAKAFIYEGKIYINVDKANMDDLAHEYMHLILGYIKVADMPLYIQLVSLVEKLPDYERYKERFKAFKDTRSIIDLKEEILVTILGEFSQMQDHVWKNLKDNKMDIQNALTESISKGFSKLFELNGDVKLKNSKGQDMTIGDVLKAYDSTLKKGSRAEAEEVIKSRTITNIIARNIKNGNIIEEC